MCFDDLISIPVKNEASPPPLPAAMHNIKESIGTPRIEVELWLPT